MNRKYALYYLPRDGEDFAMKVVNPNFRKAKKAREARDDFNTRMGKEVVAVYATDINIPFPEKLPFGETLWRDARYRPENENHKGGLRIS